MITMKLINLNVRFVDIMIVVHCILLSYRKHHDLLCLSKVLNSSEQKNDLSVCFTVSKCGDIFSNLVIDEYLYHWLVL
jgi:hypothetical protein